MSFFGPEPSIENTHVGPFEGKIETPCISIADNDNSDGGYSHSFQKFDLNPQPGKGDTKDSNSLLKGEKRSLAAAISAGGCFSMDGETHTLPDIEASIQDGTHEPLQERLTAPLCKEESGLTERSDRWADIVDPQPCIENSISALDPEQSHRYSVEHAKSAFEPFSTRQELHDLLTIQRLDSNEIVFNESRKPPKIVGSYLFGELLGEGSYGKVKEVLNIHTLCRRAIKIMKDRKLRRIPNGLQNVQTEIRLLRKLKHPNVISLFDVLRKEEKQKLYMVMEYCCGSLQEMLELARDNRLPVWQAHGYIIQLVDGLEYLHSQGVVHKDVKPGNLLLTLDETLKISDFGVAEEIDLHQGSDLILIGQGTPKFQAPEVASGNNESFSGFALDWWSTGVTLYNFISGSYPFDGSSILKLYENIVHQELKMPTSVELDRNLESFLRGLLEKDPTKRLGDVTARKHDWIKKKPPFSRLDRVPLPAFNGAVDRPLTIIPQLHILFDGQNESGLSSPAYQSDGEVSGGCGNPRRLARYLSDEDSAAGSALEFTCSATRSRSEDSVQRTIQPGDFPKGAPVLSFKGSQKAYSSADSVDESEKRREDVDLVAPVTDRMSHLLDPPPIATPIRKAHSDTGFPSKLRKRIGNNCKLQ